MKAATARSYRMEGQARYQIWEVEKERSPYRFQIVDLEKSAAIVARFSCKESAEHVAKQLNDKGYVETLA